MRVALRYKASGLQVGIALQAFFVEAEQLAGFLVGHAAFADGGFDILAQGGHEAVDVELDVVEDLTHGIALDHGVENGVADLVELDMDGVGIAEQVVEVAQDFLVSAEQESAEVVILAVGERVQREGALYVTAIDKLIDLAVGIAGDITEYGVLRGALVQSVDGHDGEQLLDGPAVGQALEQRKIAEVGVRHHGVQTL